MNVEIGTEATQFLFWEYLFRTFSIVSLQRGPRHFSVICTCVFAKMRFVSLVECELSPKRSISALLYHRQKASHVLYIFFWFLSSFSYFLHLVSLVLYPVSRLKSLVLRNLLSLLYLLSLVSCLILSSIISCLLSPVLCTSNLASPFSSSCLYVSFLESSCLRPFVSCLCLGICRIVVPSLVSALQSPVSHFLFSHSICLLQGWAKLVWNLTLLKRKAMVFFKN